MPHREFKIETLQMDGSSVVSENLDYDVVSQAISSLKRFDSRVDDLIHFYSLLVMLSSLEVMKIKFSFFKITGHGMWRMDWNKDLFISSLCRIEFVKLKVYSLPPKFVGSLFEALGSGDEIVVKHLYLDCQVALDFSGMDHIQSEAVLKLKTYRSTVTPVQARLILDAVCEAENLNLEHLTLDIDGYGFSYPSEKALKVEKKMPKFKFRKDIKLLGTECVVLNEDFERIDIN